MNLNEIAREDNESEEGLIEENVQVNGSLGNEDDEDDETSNRLLFEDRAIEMGLTVLPGGTYHYSDEYSEVAYKKVKTLEDSGIMDDTILDHLAVFTKAAGPEQDWTKQNFVSDSYKFMGNATLIDQIRESINSVGENELDERTFVAPNFTSIRHEIIIRHANTIQQVGTVFPMMNITNTYNGTGASRIVFGMNIAEYDNVVSSFCTEKFGKIKQIHLSGSSTELETAFGEFVTVFGSNISNLVSDNFNNHITEDDMLKVLDMIEDKAGKKRRDAVSNELPSTEGNVSWNMTSWQLFLALTRFTSVEKNINAKKILENITERVLVIPEQMLNALTAING